MSLDKKFKDNTVPKKVHKKTAFNTHRDILGHHPVNTLEKKVFMMCTFINT